MYSLYIFPCIVILNDLSIAVLSDIIVIPIIIQIDIHEQKAIIKIILNEELWEIHKFVRE